MGEEVDLALLLALDLGDGAFEDLDELVADDLALTLGVGDALELAQEDLGGVDDAEVDLELAAEHLLHLGAFVEAQQAVVDEDAGQLLADGALDEGGRDGGIHSAGEAEDHLRLADLLADFADGRLDVVVHLPGRLAAADAEEEVAEDVDAALGVGDLGVELDAVEAALRILDDRALGVLGGGDGLEAAREAGDLVAVRIPDAQRRLQSLQELGALAEGKRAVTVLAMGAAGDVAAEHLAHELDAVADAEHGQTHLEDAGVRVGRALGLHAIRTAGEDDADDAVGPEGLRRDAEGIDAGVDVAFADAARDDLGQLRTEIENGDGLGGHGGKVWGIQNLRRTLFQPQRGQTASSRRRGRT